MPPPRVELIKDLQRSIAEGHPWLWDRAVRWPSARPAAGALVEVVRRGRPLAIGWAEPGAPIAVRVLDAPGTDIGPAWARRRAASAAAMRAADPLLAGTDALRAVHGENDGLPGLVIDLYAGHGVAVLDGAGAAAFWRPLIEEVAAGIRDGGLPMTALWEKPQRGRGGGEGGALLGEPPPDPIVIDEHGARFEVDVRRGQKTGLFLDQRSNRRLVGQLAAGAEVLNLFGYTGGFSVHAALGGARRVTTVDLAAPAIAAARRNFALNRIDPERHRFEVADCFEMLEAAERAQQRWDLVICDPPSFAPSERSRPAALAAYRRLQVACLGVVAAGGTLVTASCSSHIGAGDLLDLLASASAERGRRLRVRHILGAGSDHPVRPGFPEGRYLDLLVCSVD